MNEFIDDLPIKHGNCHSKLSVYQRATHLPINIWWLQLCIYIYIYRDIKLSNNPNDLLDIYQCIYIYNYININIYIYTVILY